MQGYQSFIGSITNITIIEITDDTSLPRINYEGFSYQDALGSELVVNGNWYSHRGADFTINNNLIYIENVGNTYGGIEQSFVVTANKIFKLKYNVTQGTTSTDWKVDIGSTQGASDLYSKGQVSDFTENTTITSNSNQIWIRIYNNTPTIGDNFSIDNVSVKEYLGQEVVPNSGCGSWLWEPQTTQLLPYSEDFSQYSTGSSPIITGGFLAPDGTNNAYKITNSGSSTVYLSGVPNLSSTSTRSIYARSVSGTGTATLMSYFGNTNNVFTLTEQWQRFEVAESTTTVGESNFYAVDFRGSGTLSEIILWGANATNDQDYATSYIPSNGSQVTRNQDVCTNGGSLASINSTEGVFYAEIAALANDGTNRVISISDGTTANRVSIVLGSGTNEIRGQVLSSGTSFDFSATSYNTLNNNKIAISYKLNNFSMWINGTKVSADTSGNTPVGMNTISFNAGGTILTFFGKTKALAVWKEALSDAELTELTTI